MEILPSLSHLATSAVIHLIRLLPAVILLMVLENIFGRIKRSPLSGKARTDIGFLFLSLLYAPLLRHFGTLLAATGFLAIVPFSVFDGTVAQLPTALQVLLVLLLRDVCIYIRHRLFHGRRLWNFHCVHHSSTEVNWLSTVRFHPAESLIEVAINLTLFVMLRPSPDAIIVIALILGFYDYFIHADLPVSYGPLDYVFVSPVFHRWHHSTEKEARNKNFAAMFSFLDLAAGTFYLPRDKYPYQTGIASSGRKVPESFLEQLLYPFTSR